MHTYSWHGLERPSALTPRFGPRAPARRGRRRGRLCDFAPPRGPRDLFTCEYDPVTPVRCLGCRVINIGCEYVPENVRIPQAPAAAHSRLSQSWSLLACCCSFRTMANCTELRRQSQCKLQASPRDRLSETVTQACTRGRFQRRAGNCHRTRLTIGIDERATSNDVLSCIYSSSGLTNLIAARTP